MIRALGKSLRIVMMHSIPLISGICRSMSVTSGRCFLNSAIASCPLDASATNFMSGSALSSAAIPLRSRAWSSTVRIRISLTSLAMRPRLFAEGSEWTGFGGLCVSHRCRHGHLNLRASPRLAPKIQLSARQCCAFADSGQAPMSGPRAFVEYLWVNSDPVIAEPEAELLRVVPNLHFNLFSARMAESVSQNLPANPIERVLKNWFQVSRRSFDGHAESRDDATVRSSNFRNLLPGSRKQMSQV